LAITKCTEFDTDTKNDVQGQVLTSKFISNKIRDGGGRHTEIQIYGHNSVATAYICTIYFDTEAENGVLEPGLPSKFTSTNNTRWRRDLTAFQYFDFVKFQYVTLHTK